MDELQTIQRRHEAESAVVGSFFLEPDLAYETILTPEHFTNTQNRLVFEAVKRLTEKAEPIDVVMVIQELAETGNIENAGGTDTIMQLSESVPTTSNFKFYESIVLDEYKRRLMISAAAEYLNNPTDEQAGTLSKVITEVQEIGVTGEKTKLDVLFEIQNQLSTDAGGIKGADTGYPALNSMTGGLHGGDLIIVAARPSVGKTAFAINIANNVCKAGGAADIFSLEMPEEQLTKRILSSIANVNAGKWQNPFKFFSQEDHKAIQTAIGIYSQWAMNIHDHPRQTVADIRAQVRKTQRENPGKKHVVVVDYLQLITSIGEFAREDLRIGAMTRELKLMARQFNVPIILLSQLSRSVEQRQDKRPMMSDLRESGAIEQDADVIAFLYRDDYYDKETENKNVIEIILSKQRNGPTGTVELAFVKEYSKFVSLERRYDG